jgi:hypothetical protein
MEQWEMERLAARLKLIEYLIKKADEHGYTHGEKHHILHVAVNEINIAIWYLKSKEFYGQQPNQDEVRDIPNVSTIPF